MSRGGLWLPPILAAALWAIAPGLGLAAHLLLLTVLLLSLGAGELIFRGLRLRADPFLMLVTGFAAVTHLQLLIDGLVLRHPAIALACLAPAAVGLLLPSRDEPVERAAPALASLLAVVIFVWCADVTPRVAQFHASGQLNFWHDLLIHTTNLMQFSAPDMVGRGMALMADWPRPLYHNASMMPVALLPPLADVVPFDAAALAWIPLGMVVMGLGVVALGLALGGPWLAASALLALAAVPTPERWTLDNGFLGFAWLLETAPGTPYSLGIGCAAFAALVRASKQRSVGALVLAFLLTGACFLTRANTFVWLAPAIALGAIAVWWGAGSRFRPMLLSIALLGFVCALVLLSWRLLSSDPQQFLFGYVKFLHTSKMGARIDGLYAVLLSSVGPTAAGLVGVMLALLGTLGPWLPGFLLLGALAWRRGLVSSIDVLPLLLLIVGTLTIMLSPIGRNGDISEFRHRPGPLLVVVLAIWTIRFAGLLLAGWLNQLSRQAALAALAAVAVPSLVVLALSIGHAKQWVWVGATHGEQVAPEIMAFAPLLQNQNVRLPRFAVANQPSDSTTIDDAARLIALSGMPAFISCPGFLLATGGRSARKRRGAWRLSGGLQRPPISKACVQSCARKASRITS